MAATDAPAGINPGLAVPGLGKEPDANANDEEAAKLNEIKTILAELCVKAPNHSVRDCLRKYDPSKQQWQITRAFDAELKSVLVETLDYLGVPDMNKYLAKALPNELFCRVQNLLPDTCHLCKAKYCLKINDKPVVSCVKCGQGCHNECILKIINKTEDDLAELTSIEREALINPHSTIGLFYVCGPCQESTIPQQRKLMKRATFAQDLENPLPLHQPVPPTNTTAVTNDAAASGTHNPPTVAAPAANDTPHVAPPSDVAIAENTTNNPSRPTPVPVCKHYKNARCKYGISGKKDGEGVCPYSHPKLCKKLIEHGNRGPRGCTKGETCELFHPKMCHRSLRDRTCINPSFKFMHVKGTKRTEVTIQVGESTNINYRDNREIPHEAVSSHSHRMSSNSHAPSHYGTPQYSASQYAAPQYTPQYTGTQYAPKPTPRDNQSQDYFLDALLQMKAEILKELDRKLQQTYHTQFNHQVIPQMYNTLPVHHTIPNHPTHQHHMQNQFPPLPSHNQGQMVTH